MIDDWSSVIENAVELEAGVIFYSKAQFFFSGPVYKNRIKALFLVFLTIFSF
jgi:hypothetical protein